MYNFNIGTSDFFIHLINAHIFFDTVGMVYIEIVYQANPVFSETCLVRIGVAVLLKISGINRTR